MAVKTVKSIPALGPIYAKAALPGKSPGKDLPDTQLRLAGHAVDRSDLLAYQRICGFNNSDVLPHTYPHVVGFPLQMQLMAGKGFPLPLMGLVHVENVITVHREIRFDEALDITVSADNLRAHPKGKVVDLVTEVDVDGERVWEGRSTYLARGRGDAGAERGEQPPTIPTGQAAARWSLPGGLGRTYGLASGDINPIHMSAVTAKAMGFPKAIAHGMWTYARVLGAIGPVTSGPCTSHVWFKKPVLLPGKVDFVIDKSGDQVVAGLRSSRKPETEHLVLSLS
ncbi:dehydratase [Janibacter sp. Soil728]|uniref:MaoC/PaaZ C-terminal domain-containing protein n=1 Tax=Janibacter sp. Soil728 TaxID=1736393 RepID=UPI0007014427|nr:MaoC/PaaZ C-terminal domain-containing protein [Janibacter sp. Soil728]KRE36937.1 dehydratase [Janibacter sp. Soil728]